MKKKSLSEGKAFILLFLAFFLLIPLAAISKPSEISIKINDVSGLDSPWPLIASIPFAEGQMKDASAIRIMSGTREVPSQVDVAATWRDGSIRWVLAGFTDSPGGNYRVEYGAGVKRGVYPNPLVGRRRIYRGDRYCNIPV
ncbi:MAG TPA: hypothetical protein PKN36_05125 [bacterium]|nr:hypothetical protein [bacterium]